MRSGLIAQKLGMTRVFADDGGRMCPVTVLKVDTLPGRRGADRGEGRLQRRAAGCRHREGEERLQGPARPLRQGEGRAEAQAGRVPRVAGRRWSRSAPSCRPPISCAGQFVDVVGTTIGKGFAGVDEALELRRSARHPRRVGLAPQRTVRPVNRQDPGPHLRRQEDGRPPGRRAASTTQNLKVVSTDAGRRPDPGPGRGPRPRGRLCPGATTR